MSGLDVDRVARRLARSRFSRRDTLRSGGLGVAATLLAMAGVAKPDRGAARQASPVAATPEAGVKTTDGWLCKQQYALCTTAPCEASDSDAKIVNCRCLVEDGHSFGFTECNERTPAGDTVISTFSTQDVTTTFHELSCPEGSPWADCLDMPCTIDPDDPKQATCQCQIVETGGFVTMGGDCDTNTCSSVIWSGNYLNSTVVPQYVSAMKEVNQQVMLPQTCPGAAATPATA